MSRKNKRGSSGDQNNPREKTPERKTVSFIDRFGFLVTLIMVSVLLLVVFRDFIFENAYYLFKDIGSDSLNGAYPLYVSITNYLKTDGFPLWSFQEGMGQNIMALTNNRDPFSWMVYIGSVDNIMYRVIWLELFKMILTAAAFYQFLKLWGLNFQTRLIGTILYTFSGFMIIGSGWTVFSAEACLLAILLLGFEQFYQNRSWYLFPIAVMLIAFRPFNLYFYSFFLVLYFIMRHLISEDHSWKKFMNVSVRLVGFGLLGIAISSFFFVSSLQMMLDSPRVGGSSSYVNKLISIPVFALERPDYYTTLIMRFFSNDILGNGSDFKGWHNYMEAPMVYIGLLPLLMAPQLFYFADRKKKMIFGLFLLFFIIPAIFPFFRLAVWLFMGDYFRGYSLFLSLVVLIPALLSIDHLDKGGRINIPLLTATLLFLIVLLFLPYPGVKRMVEPGLRLAVIIFLIFYFVILIVSDRSRPRKRHIPLLAIVVIIEAAFMNITSIKDREALSHLEAQKKVGYNDFSVEAIEFINETDRGFFRVNKDYSSGPAEHSSINDAKVHGYYGTMNYSSYNQRYYIRFLEEMGIIKRGDEESTRWSTGLANNAVLLTLASNKYFLCKNPDAKKFYRNIGYDSLAIFGDVTLLENRNFLPLGYTYEKCIPLKNFRQISNVVKKQTLLMAFVAEESVGGKFSSQIEEFDMKDTSGIYTYTDYLEDVGQLLSDTLRMIYFSQNLINGEISIDKTKLLFFSIPYDKGWRAKIDGEEVRPLLCNIGFMGLVISPGSHHVELSFRPQYFTLSLVITMIGLVIYLLLATRVYLRKRRMNERSRT